MVVSLGYCYEVDGYFVYHWQNIEKFERCAIVHSIRE